MQCELTQCCMFKWSPCAADRTMNDRKKSLQRSQSQKMLLKVHRPKNASQKIMTKFLFIQKTRNGKCFNSKRLNDQKRMVSKNSLADKLFRKGPVTEKFVSKGSGTTKSFSY